METEVKAEDGRQEIWIYRDFALPLELLFRAYEDPALFEQWMGTRVIKMENKTHGSYAFETSYNGQVVMRAHGTIHEFTASLRITRTFEMEDSTLPVQLEILTFEALSDTTSRLTMQIIFQSIAARDQPLRLPFAYGLNHAHNQLQQILSPKP